ncbi:hypothetical protein MPDQ_002198 [Monascus purpureus]|uniref:Uncharacterized protein n=1 Tax=Monascus purpureus TaxID=5098 RepID=A0A507QQ96_MONPU|nr:hypothetical protein MPDQ_002198 [Monascus purpureus]
MPITPTEVLQVLKGKGPLEVYSIVATPYFYDPWMNVYTYTYVCNVTFAYVDDCKDAIKYFKNDFRYYMILLDVDGNPLLPTVPDSNSNSNSNLMEDLVGKAPETPRSQDVLYEIRDKGNVWYPDQVGRKVEKYVRTAYEQGEDDLDDEQIMSVVQDLEKYQKTKGRLGDWYNGDVPRHWEMQPAAPPAPTTEDSSESSQSLDGSEDVSKAAEVEDKNAEGDKEKDEMNDNDNETDKNDGDTKGKDDDKKDVDGPEKTNDSDSDGNNTKEDPRTEKLNN